jgi:hypothetical protein
MSKNATWGQAVHSLTIIGQQNLNADHIRVLHDGYLATLAKAARDGMLPTHDEFKRMLGLVFTLNPITGLPLVELWQMAKYDHVAYDIERHLGALKVKERETYPSVEVEMWLADAETPQEQWKSITASGYRPAVIREFLSFGVRYPEAQRKFRIFCLTGGKYLTYMDCGPLTGKRCPSSAQRQLSYGSWEERHDSTLDKNVMQARVLVVREK